MAPALFGPTWRTRSSTATATPFFLSPAKKPRTVCAAHSVASAICATVAQIAEATGWAPHTVRGFFAGLKRKGVEVAVLERVRQLGPDKEGAKGGYTVYRVAGAG